MSILLHSGSNPGITETIGEYGDILRKIQSYKPKIYDVTLDYVGYQTDNGATYCFCEEKNCSNTLINTLKSLKESGTPMGYLSFQGAGASSGRGTAAPWCVDLWGVDGGLGPQYPMSLKDLHESIGIPLQLYAPYFCPKSPYFTQNSSKLLNFNWKSVVSDETLDQCQGFMFQDVTPAQSLDFYTSFFSRGKNAGMESFEPDFMNQNYNCVPEFIQQAGLATEWQLGMANAGLAQNVSIQWCYATPTDVMNSLIMPSVTNFRVSSDFCYGMSWDIGISSLLVWAMGASPSKDTLWTSTNDKFSVPGCDWTPDHEEPAVSLHVILALMSSGPMGISDLNGKTNTTLLKHAITEDGHLLKPLKPITSIDSMMRSEKYRPKGYIMGTYSTGPSWYFVSFKLQNAFNVSLADFYPSPDVKTRILVSRIFDSGFGCKNGSIVQSGSTCVNRVTEVQKSNIIFRAPMSSFQNVTGGTDFHPVLTTVWKVCELSGWVFMGELHKFVAVSPRRFEYVNCLKNGVEAAARGSPGEKIKVTILKPDASLSWKVLVEEVVLNEYGFASLSFH
mmetsp:Transcript_10641/g.15869  ORF Transcript_10641/g.15869 Transcript_10641/m.15869 type:complete len:561 (+) Transcript_10641:185-1867(+)